jgi:6-phosphogluconolactonase
LRKIATAAARAVQPLLTMADLYLLPFDHRSSFEHRLFGWSGALSHEQTAQITAAKQVIYDALLAAIDQGVARDRAGVLVDEQYGRAILADARARSIVTACPTERSGQAEFDFEYGADFAAHIESMDPTYCKVLVRYNPQGDAAMNRRQVDRLRALSEYLRRTHRRFLFELLVPAEPAQLARSGGDSLAYDLQLRPALAITAMRELQDAGVEPDLWKVEGFDRREDCVLAAKMARRAGRDARCIVLGRHAEDARVQHWLEVAASVSGFVGFAVGRTTFWQPLKDLLAHHIGRPEAVHAIARTYRRWVDIWDAARRTRTVEIFADREDLIRGEAERIVELARGAIATRGRFSCALSGGSTPRPLYELLATPPFATGIDWSRVHLFWGDERCVPPDHPDSNFRMTREALLDHVPIPSANVHRIHGEDEPDAAARAYEQDVRAYFGVAQGPPAQSFDLVLLGMGADGHTASLFPGTLASNEQQRWALANHVAAARDAWRITLTPVVLNAAAEIAFLVTGASKADRLWQVLEAPTSSQPLPAQLIHPSHGVVHWMVDADAARRLQEAP